MVVENKSLINLAGLFTALAASLEKDYMMTSEKNVRILVNNAALNEVVANEAVKRLINELDPKQAEAWLHRYEAITSELYIDVIDTAVEMAEVVQKKTKSSDGIKD